MNKFLQFLLLSLVLISLSSLVSGQEREVFKDGYYVQVGDMAPDFKIVEDGGKEYMLSDLKGSVVMLQFTASWCGVCRKEMPYIEKDIWLPGKEKGLKVIGVDRDEPLATVKKFKEQLKVTYPLALDPGADIFGLFADKKAGVTRNVIIDRNGKIIFLTRLFEMEEFTHMKELIFKELQK